MIYCSVK